MTAKTSSQSYAAADWQKKNKYTDNSALTTFITETYGPAITTLEGQIDGKAETWYQSTDPASAWTTTALKDAHVGDLWYKTTDNTTWYYDKSGSTYSWKQQNVPNEVFDEIDGKAQVFISQPTVPYDVGDIWFVGSTGDILTCVTAKTSSQSYAAADWQKRNKYVDSATAEAAGAAAAGTAITAYDNTLNQQKIFDKLTNNGAAQGIYLQNNQLYVNAAYIATGILADTSGNTSWNLSTGALSSKIFSIDSTNITLDNGSITLGDIKLGENNTTRYYRRIVIGDGQIVTKNVTQSTSDPESTDIHDATKTVTTIGTLSSTTSYPGSSVVAPGTGLISERNLILEAKSPGSCYLKADNGGVNIVGNGGTITIGGDYISLYTLTNKAVSLGPNVRVDNLQVSNGRTGIYHQWLSGLSQDIEINGKVASFKNGVLVSYS